MKKFTTKQIVFTLIGLFLIISIVLVLLPKNTGNKKEFLKKYDLNNLTVEQMVLQLEQITNEPEGFKASITGTTFTVGDKKNLYTFDVPSNKFYLSLAPYINNTHPCSNHNLVTCRGELKNTTVNVLIKDVNGNEIINGNYTSHENGFIGIWLPKDITGTITVNYQGLQATNDISTYASSNTCLTTLQLK